MEQADGIASASAERTRINEDRTMAVSGIAA
jgi:hypothetical protein